MQTVALLRRVLAGAFVTAIAAPTLLAQDVQYRTVTKIDMGTGMNIALRITGSSENAQTTYVKGRKMRTETGKDATIFDLDKGRVLIINGDNKTYVSAPIAQMAAAVSAMASNAGANVHSDKGQMGLTARDSAGNKADFTFHVNVDPTGEHQTVNGADSRRLLETVETDVKVTPEGDTQATDAGTLVILIDSWNATDGPAYSAVQNFQQTMMKQMASQNGSNMRGMSALFAQNPQMGEAMQKAAAEQQKAGGIPMRSTTYLVLVPPSVKFDRDAVLKPQQQGAGSVAKRAMGGMLGGMLGGRAKEQPKDNQDMKQTTIMKMTTDVQDVQTTSLSSSLFEPPAGYREIPFNAPPGR